MQKNHDQTLNAFLEGRKRKLLGGCDATIPFLMQRLPVLLAAASNVSPARDILIMMPHNMNVSQLV